MTLTRRVVLACGVALALPAPLAGQPTRPGYVAQTDGRLVIEGLFSRHQVAPAEGVRSRSALDGLGGRLLWTLASVDAPPSGWTDRLSAGAFVLVGSDPTKATRTVHSGAQVDYRLARERMPRVEPLVSLGAGWFRTTARAREASRSRILRPDNPHPFGAPAMFPVRRENRAEESWSSLALTPGFGARLRLSPDFAIRLEARDVMAFRAPVRHTPELTGGLSLRL